MPHVLLVDDDDVLRHILARLLSQTGHSVVEAADGPAALERAAGEAFDAIVVDVMMPEMDGYELVRRLRARPATAATPVLLVTASLAGPDPARARAAGATGFAMKTANPSRLHAQLMSALEQAGVATGRAAPEGNPR